MNITVNAYTYWQLIGPIEWVNHFRSQCPEDLRNEIDQHIPHRIAVRWSLLGIHAVHCSGCGRMLWQELSRGDVSLLP